MRRFFFVCGKKKDEQLFNIVILVVDKKNYKQKCGLQFPEAIDDGRLQNSNVETKKQINKFFLHQSAVSCKKGTFTFYFISIKDSYTYLGLLC